MVQAYWGLACARPDLVRADLCRASVSHDVVSPHRGAVHAEQAVRQRLPDRARAIRETKQLLLHPNARTFDPADVPRLHEHFPWHMPKILCQKRRNLRVLAHLLRLDTLALRAQAVAQRLGRRALCLVRQRLHDEGEGNAGEPQKIQRPPRVRGGLRAPSLRGAGVCGRFTLRIPILVLNTRPRLTRKQHAAKFAERAERERGTPEQSG